MSVDPKNLERLSRKATVDGHWPVVASCSDLAQDSGNLDKRINLVGAMHGQGFLENRLAPWRRTFAAGSRGWVTRCVERLATGDHDIWAVSALLLADLELCHSVLSEHGFDRLSQYDAHFRFNAGQASLYSKSRPGQVMAPVIELACALQDAKIRDVSRARAFVWTDLNLKGGNIWGSFSASYLHRASLPHGVWRNEGLRSEIKEQWLVGP